jgi:homoserine kinase
MKWAEEPVTVQVPATSANLGPGFDSLGLALTLHDFLEARITGSDVSIEVYNMRPPPAATGEGRLIADAVQAGFDAMGAQPPGLSVICRSAIPQGFGLGSSAAAIVASLLAARALAGPDGLAALPDPALLQLACRLEGHPDNVAACFFGGLVVAWESAPGAVEVARLEPAGGLAPVVCVPSLPLSTRVARQALPAQVPHADAAANSARSALLIAALTGRPDLLLAGTEDFLHQGYRAASMPATAALLHRLRSAGIAAVVSGAGPSVLALAAGAGGQDKVAELAGGGAWEVIPLRVDVAGAQVIQPGG